MNGEYITAPDELPDGGFSGSAMPMPVSSMSDQQYMQAALAAPTPPAPGVTMAAGPAVAKNPNGQYDASVPGTSSYAQAALAASETPGPGPEAGYAQRAIDSSASVVSAPARVVGVSSGGGPARETVAILPKAREALDKADDATTGAGFKSQLNAMSNAESEADYMRRESLKAQAQVDAREDEKARRSAEMQRMGDDMAKTSAELAKFKVDPDRQEKARGTGSRILDGIAAGLLSFGGKSTDPVFKRIEADNDRDVDAQKQEYAARLQGQKAKETTYEKMMQRYGTEDAAEAATRAAGMDRAKYELGAISADARSGDAQAAYGDLLGQVEARKQKYIADHVKMTGGKSQTFAVRLGNGETVQMSPAQYNQFQIANGVKDADASRSAGVAVATEQAKGRTEGGKEQRKDEKDDRERFVPTDNKGGGYLAPTSAEAAKDRGGRKSISEVRDLVNEIKSLRKQAVYGDKVAGAGGVETPIIAKLRSAKSKLTQTLNSEGGLGAYDAGAAELLNNQIGGVDSFNPLKSPEANLDAIMSGLDKKLRNSESGGVGYTMTAPSGAKQGWGK